MSVLKITAFKAKHRVFTGYTGAGVPQFIETEYMQVFGCFDLETDAARYIVDELIRTWNTGSLGTVPEHFRVESGTTDKIYRVRPSEAGETPDITSPTLGDYYFKPEITIRG